MYNLNQNTKFKQNRGTGSGANYLPWITTHEFASSGTTANPIDWRTGRTVHLLSQGELIAWLILNFDDETYEVKEQYPLDISETLKIAEDLGINHPMSKGEPFVMTTDFLVEKMDGTMLAVSIKCSENKLDNSKTQQKNSLIEKEYWEQQGIKYEIWFKNKLNKVLANNIDAVTQYYKIDEKYPDEFKVLKHLVAVKKIKIDMNKKIDYVKEVSIHRKEINEWMIQNNYI